MTATQTPASSPPYAKGLDLSQWQGPNFPVYQAIVAGYTFAYLRATVRARHDPCYATNRTRALDAGLLTGFYHYLYPSPVPTEQAAAFYQSLRSQQSPPD